MTRWAYNIIEVPFTSNILAVLNTLGADGWECFKTDVSGCGYPRLWVKRPYQSDPASKELP